MYLFQSLQLILHALIDSRRSNMLTRQLFYHLCQSSHLSSEHQLVVSTFVELIEYLQLVQFLMYILCLDWILLRDSDTRLLLIHWCHIDDDYHLLLMIRMKCKHHVNDVLLSKKIDVNSYNWKLKRITLKNEKFDSIKIVITKTLKIQKKEDKKKKKEHALYSSYSDSTLVSKRMCWNIRKMLIQKMLIQKMLIQKMLIQKMLIQKMFYWYIKMCLS